MNYLDFVMESKLLGRKLPPPFPQLASYSSVSMVAMHGVANLFQLGLEAKLSGNYMCNVSDHACTYVYSYRFKIPCPGTK